MFDLLEIEQPMFIRVSTSALQLQLSRSQAMLLKVYTATGWPQLYFVLCRGLFQSPSRKRLRVEEIRISVWQT